MKVLEGVSNKVGFLLAFLSACCWVVYVVGFALDYQSHYVEGNSTASSDDVEAIPYFGFWMYAVCSLPLYLTLLSVFLCSNTLFSLTLVLLAPLALLSMGAMLQVNGMIYYQYYLLTTSESPAPSTYVHVQVAGALGALLSLWAALNLWVCAIHRGRKITDYQQIN